MNIFKCTKLTFLSLCISGLFMIATSPTEAATNRFGTPLKQIEGCELKYSGGEPYYVCNHVDKLNEAQRSSLRGQLREASCNSHMKVCSGGRVFARSHPPHMAALVDSATGPACNCSAWFGYQGGNCDGSGYASIISFPATAGTNCRPLCNLAIEYLNSADPYCQRPSYNESAPIGFEF